MFKHIKAPGSLEGLENTLKIFLAGSIEQGKAIDWQTRLAKALEGHNVVILNPRRDDWDSSWKEDIKNKQFNEQVTWELDAQEMADIIVMYFDKDTKSPISLLELGLFAKTGKMIVCCPEGFWKKGNVDIVCERYDVQQAGDMDKLIETLAETIPKNKA